MHRYARGPKVRLAGAINKKSTVWEILQKFTALPLLPAGEIHAVFNHSAAEAVAADVRFIQFVACMRKQWMKESVYQSD